jgi:hypothetical protein
VIDVDQGSTGKLATEDAQTLVLHEVVEVFDVPGGQREVIGQATRGYPRVIRRSGPASEVGVRGDGAPRAGHVVAVENVFADQPAGE